MILYNGDKKNVEHSAQEVMRIMCVLLQIIAEKRVMIFSQSTYLI